MEVWFWNDTVLQGVYIQGLWEELKDDLAGQDGTPDLEALICLTTHLDRDGGKSTSLVIFFLTLRLARVALFNTFPISISCD